MSDRILTAVMLLVAVLATVPAVNAAFPYAGLVLVVLGLVAGFMAELDVQHRIAYYVLAGLLPSIANGMDVIPVLGPWLNSLLDAIALGLQGSAVALFLLAVKSKLMPAE